MEYRPNAMPNERVDAVSVLASVLTETTKAEPSLRTPIFLAMENFISTTMHFSQTSNNTQVVRVPNNPPAIQIICGVTKMYYTT
jgi:hypothetical protein